MLSFRRPRSFALAYQTAGLLKLTPSYHGVTAHVVMPKDVLWKE